MVFKVNQSSKTRKNPAFLQITKFLRKSARKSFSTKDFCKLCEIEPRVDGAFFNIFIFSIHVQNPPISISQIFTFFHISSWKKIVKKWLTHASGAELNSTQFATIFSKSPHRAHFCARILCFSKNRKHKKWAYFCNIHFFSENIFQTMWNWAARRAHHFKLFFSFRYEMWKSVKSKSKN